MTRSIDPILVSPAPYTAVPSTLSLPIREPVSLTSVTIAVLHISMRTKNRRNRELFLRQNAMAARSGLRARFRIDRKPVEHMRPQRVAFRQRWIVEVVGGVAAHAQPFHDRARAVVCRGRKGNDLRKRNDVEPVTQRESGRLCRIAVAPMFE